MDEELEQKLVEEYPEMYRNYGQDPDSFRGPVPPLTAFGFSVGDGWYDLIKSLSETLSRLKIDIRVEQVKEKFGGLRFYYTVQDYNDENHLGMSHGASRMAEEMSFSVCERCGDNAKHRNSKKWLKTLCDECYTEERAKRGLDVE